MNHDTFDLRGWLVSCPSPPATIAVSPALAGSILRTCTLTNTSLKRTVTSLPITVLKAQFDGLWRPEINAPVVFSRDGVLLNGHHRLKAISTYDRAVPLCIATCDDSPDTRASFDVAVKPRGLVVQLTAAGLNMPHLSGSSYSRGGIPVVIAALNVLHSRFYEVQREVITLPYYRDVLEPRYSRIFAAWPDGNNVSGGDSANARRSMPVDAWALIFAWEQANPELCASFRSRLWGEESRTANDTVRAAMLWWRDEKAKPPWDRTRIGGRLLVIGFARRLIDAYRAHCGGRAARKAPTAMKRVPIHGTKYIYWPGSTDIPGA